PAESAATARRNTAAAAELARRLAEGVFGSSSDSSDADGSGGSGKGGSGNGSSGSSGNGNGGSGNGGSGNGNGGSSGSGSGPSVSRIVRRTRTPMAKEQTAARVLARALDTAAARERTAVKTTWAVPPGRVRMRGVLARQAQLAAGTLPTAEPFTRTIRKTNPYPPLRVGIACDVSASMGQFAAPVSSAAWIIARAAELTALPATTATVTFGNTVIPITYPGIAPTQVTEFGCPDGNHAIDYAIAALEGALGLARPGGVRLLVIVSDGIYTGAHRDRAQKRLDALRAAGCAVLWLAPARGRINPLRNSNPHLLTNPAATAAEIARAATAAVRAA
ncbi:vWA domain-containing protein, partial [Nocardia puris]